MTVFPQYRNKLRKGEGLKQCRLDRVTSLPHSEHMTRNKVWTSPSGGLETQASHFPCEPLYPHPQQEDEDNNTELECCCEAQMISWKWKWSVHYKCTNRTISWKKKKPKKYPQKELCGKCGTFCLRKLSSAIDLYWNQWLGGKLIIKVTNQFKLK